MTELKVTTGDTKHDRRLRQVGLCFDQLNRNVRLTVDDAYVRLDLSHWQALAIQVRTRSLHEWLYKPDYPPPLGLSDVRKVTGRIDSTASYQLFMAAVEIAEVLHIHSDRGDLEVSIAFLYGRFISTSQNGLFFLPQDFRHDSAAFLELLHLNKICQLDITFDSVVESPSPQCIVLRYVPYATPSVSSMTTQARLLWDQIRRLYVTARGGW